jgi:GNAT superfamily N-acetyltransferase
MGPYTASRRQTAYHAAGSLINKPFKLEAAAPLLSANRPQIEKIGLASTQGQMPEIGIRSIGQLYVTQLAARHEADFRDMLLNLDKPSRAIRFDGTVTDDGMVRHSRCAFSSAAWIAGVFVDEGLRGVVEVYDIGHSRTVEAAFVVEQTWRRRGLGSALLKAAIQWAAETDRIMLRMVFSRRNWAMRKLASNAQARLDLRFGEVMADIAIDPSRVRL